MDSIELPLEGAGILTQRHGYERSADACNLHAGRNFLCIHAEIGQYATDTSALGIKTFFERVEGRGLPQLDAVE